MKCSINLNQLLYIIFHFCTVNLLLFSKNVHSFKSSTSPIVRHPGTCSSQSQAACTFSLLCYLAGGLPIEGCEGSSSTTCCVLQHTPSIKQILDYSKLKSANDENTVPEQQQQSNQKSNLIHQDNSNNNVQSKNLIQPLSIAYSDQTSSNNVVDNNNDGLSKSSLDDRQLDSTSINNSNDDANSLHSSSSSLSASTNSYDDSMNGYQIHQIHHSPRSLYQPPISHPSSIQYHHRLQHTYSTASTNPHHLNHQKQHEQNLYMHHQRLASHYPSLNHHNSIYHGSIYHHPHHSTYNSPYQTSSTGSNARSFQLSRYNDPTLFSPYQSNYLLNENLNYYTGDSSAPSHSESPSYSDHSLNSFSNYNDQPNPYQSLGDLSSPTSHSILSPATAYNPMMNNVNSQLNNEPDNNSPYGYSQPQSAIAPSSPTNLPTSSVPSSSSLLSSYSPTQTIDYKTYQKHSVQNPNSYSTPTNNNNHHHLQFPPIYSTSSSSTSSFESTTNHTTNNNHLLNSNKIFDAKTPTIVDSTATVEPSTSIKYFNTNLGVKNSDYYESIPPNTNYNTLTNTQSDDSLPSPLINSDEENRLLLDNSRLIDEDEYNNNAIRRSRLASTSPLNSITINERLTQGRNFIGEDICGLPVSKPTARIIGGQDASPFEFPWMAHIKVGAHQCGGALVSRDYVVSAAHCGKLFCLFILLV